LCQSIGKHSDAFGSLPVRDGAGRAVCNFKEPNPAVIQSLRRFPKLLPGQPPHDHNELFLQNLRNPLVFGFHKTLSFQNPAGERLTLL